MAKKEIHPDYHEITVVMTDGSKFKTKSCYGKKGDELKLDVDTKNHPAWRDDSAQFVNIKNIQVSKFKKKFGNFDF
jgi:large subunit ribosomal protein L31